MRKSTIAVIAAIVVIVLAVGLYAAFFIKPTSTPNVDAFAKCISEKGATFYGASWCGHCANQKQLFNSSFQYVNYVECTENEDLCKQKGVEAFPTWIINGTKYEGEQSFQQLSGLTGCPVP